MRPRLHNLLLRPSPLPRRPHILLRILTINTLTIRITNQVLTEAIAIKLETMGFGASAFGIFGGANGSWDVHDGEECGGRCCLGVVVADGAEGVFAVDAFAAAYVAFDSGVEAYAIFL